MGNSSESDDRKLAEIETREWLDSFDYVLQEGGKLRAASLLETLRNRAGKAGIRPAYSANTPYINTIPPEQQPPFPGGREIERRIKSLVRWNALAMVVRANRRASGIGGHISTYASAATLFEVGFNHFFRAKTEEHEGDHVYFQGHASPGVYARAFVEGRLSENELENFRRELSPDGGLSSYPHPWLMPDFWSFPTVSMGLTPIMAIYRARFSRYLEARGLKEPSDAKIWALIGDGETDEPESLGAITLAAREKLDNLIFVVNCNLQRLDGPVRGNGNIIQELEAVFRGAGWNVIKVIWGCDWDPLFAIDEDGLLVRRLGEIVDGQWQKFSVETGAYIREHAWGKDPRLLKMVDHLSDEQLRKLRLGGHDPEKIYAAYRAAAAHTGEPTVILARTIKGYGLGESGEGKNITHQQKKMNEEELREFRSRFGIPISDREIAEAPFYRPPEDSPERRHIQKRREALGGYVPARSAGKETLELPPDSLFEELLKGSGDRDTATTIAVVRLISKLMRDKRIGKRIVPIVPDEARTFGMESLFRQAGIYAPTGQLYEPVDRKTLLYYRETEDGQILEEGITEAGSMSSFIAAATAGSDFGIEMIPFFIFYSMFGFQRIGDLIWAAADSRCRGFLVGGTSGRTTLAGEGLQHQDGHSHLLAYSVPNLAAYDPAFAYEIAVIVREGLRRMFGKKESLFYYLTVTNEFYPMPAMPEGSEEGILKGMYCIRASKKRRSKRRAQILGSGAILREALKAGEILEKEYSVAADVWSVPSYKELYRNGQDVERWNRLHPGAKRRISYVEECLAGAPGVIVAATDYMKALPDSVARWMPRPPVSLGTDGFGRSDTREALRDFFEVDSRHIALAALCALARDGTIQPQTVRRAMEKMDVNPDKANPLYA